MCSSRDLNPEPFGQMGYEFVSHWNSTRNLVLDLVSSSLFLSPSQFLLVVVAHQQSLAPREESLAELLDPCTNCCCQEVEEALNTHTKQEGILSFGIVVEQRIWEVCHYCFWCAIRDCYIVNNGSKSIVLVVFRKLVVVVCRKSVVVVCRKSVVVVCRKSAVVVRHKFGVWCWCLSLFRVVLDYEVFRSCSEGARTRALTKLIVLWPPPFISWFLKLAFGGVHKKAWNCLSAFFLCAAVADDNGEPGFDFVFRREYCQFSMIWFRLQYWWDVKLWLWA